MAGGYCPECIVQLYVVGYRRRENKWIDSHGDSISRIFRMIQMVSAHEAQAVIIERDIDFPAKAQIEQELKTLKSIFLIPSSVFCEIVES